LVGRLQTVRFASARYSLPSAWVGKQVEVSVDDDEVVIAYDGREIERHPLMAPGEISIQDEHYQGLPGGRFGLSGSGPPATTRLHLPRPGRRGFPAGGGRGRHLPAGRGAG
jgi:hypothetical protein